MKLRVCIHAYMHIHTYTHASHTCIYIYVYIYIYIYIYTYISGPYKGNSGPSLYFITAKPDEVDKYQLTGWYCNVDDKKAYIHTYIHKYIHT